VVVELRPLGSRPVDVALRHPPALRDQVHEHAEERQHNREDRPAGLAPPEDVVAAEDVCPHREEQPDPHHPQEEGEQRPDIEKRVVGCQQAPPRYRSYVSARTQAITRTASNKSRRLSAQPRTPPADPETGLLGRGHLRRRVCGNRPISGCSGFHHPGDCGGFPQPSPHDPELVSRRVPLEIHYRARLVRARLSRPRCHPSRLSSSKRSTATVVRATMHSPTWSSDRAVGPQL
jgi:hypothetical protein